jgi:transposase
MSSNNNPDFVASLPVTRKYTPVNNAKRALIINAIDVLGKTVSETAVLFNTKPSTVSSIKRAFYKDGRVAKKTQGGNRKQILSTTQKELILDWIDGNVFFLPQF